MSKNVNDSIIALRKDGSITVHRVSDIDKVTKKKFNTGKDQIEFLLIDIGVHSPQYIQIPRKDFIRKFKEATFRSTLYTEAYCDGLTQVDELQTSTITCKNVVEFYRMLHSLYKLRAVDGIRANTFDVYLINTENYLKNVTIMTNIDGDIKEFDIENQSESHNKHNIIYVIETINFMVYEDCSKDIIPAIRHDETLYINTRLRKWSYDEDALDEDDTIVSVSEMNFNCMLFITRNDLELFRKAQEVKLYFTIYMLMPNNPLPYDTEVTSENLYELDGYYIEILAERDLLIYQPNGLMEIIANFKYIYMNMIMQDDVIHGLMDNRILAEIVYTFDGAVGERCHYSKTLKDFEGVDDFYNDFMHRLEKNYKKFKKGGHKNNGSNLP
jgi:hypothetical protein